jgi:quercetin dioxygenase-like cupin family protein
MSDVRPLAALVAFQDGAVVSRTLLKAPGGTLTLFAFDAGQELSEHATPYAAYLHVLEGEADVRVGGTPNVVGAGDAIELPPTVPHAVRAVTRCKILLAMVR